jgi:hypothetical protein
MRKLTLAGALGAACLLTTPAMAAEPCPSVKLADDNRGDAAFYTAVPAPASTDIVEGTIRTADRKTTVTFKVADLTKTVPAYSTGLGWYFEYTTGGQALFVNADLAPDGTVTYGAGTDGQSYTPTGTTTGTFDEAKDEISIVLPGLTSGTKRYELTTKRFATYGAIGAATPLGSAAFLPGADTAASDDHTTTPCSTATTPAA